jgi:hypothetical protein
LKKENVEKQEMSKKRVNGNQQIPLAFYPQWMDLPESPSLALNKTPLSRYLSSQCRFIHFVVRLHVLSTD